MQNTRSRALNAAGYILALAAFCGPALTACGGGTASDDPAHQRASLAGPARVEFAAGPWSGAQTAMHQVGELDLAYTNTGATPAALTCALTGTAAFDAGGGYSGGREAGAQLVLSIGGLPLPPATLAPEVDVVQISAMVPPGKLATCTTWLRIYTLSAGVQAAPAAVLSLSGAVATLDVQP
jgi:hypothetical protein